jgi:hypothetical protein
MGTLMTLIGRIRTDFILLRRISDLCILSVKIRLIRVISVPIVFLKDKSYEYKSVWYY